MRESGVDLAAAFAEGVQRQGLDVVDLGLASTDLVYFAAGHLDAPGAMFTASHNPAQYNGIKMCLAGARPIGQDTGLAEIRRMTAAGVEPALTAPGRVEAMDLLGAFADHVRSFVDVDALAPLQVVADTANGMGGLVVPRVFDTPAGRRSRSCTASSTAASPTTPPTRSSPRTCATCRPGCGRRAPTSGWPSTATPTGCSWSTTRASRCRARPPPRSSPRASWRRSPAPRSSTTSSAPSAVPEVIEENGGTAVRTRVGHSFIKAVMAETGAAFGGEHSAHYYFRDNFRADSGSIAALMVLEQISKAGVPLSTLRKPFDRYAASGEINTTVDDAAAVIERVAAAYPDADQDRADGLTVELGGLVVQPAAVQHRAAAAAQPRGPDPGGVRRARRRGAGPHQRQGMTPWHSTPSSWRSWPARRTRARSSTSRTRTRCTTPG